MFRSPKSKEKKKNVETKLLTEFLKSPQEFQTKEKFKPIFNSYSKSGSQFLTETETLGFLSSSFAQAFELQFHLLSLDFIADILQCSGRSEKLKKNIPKQPKVKVDWEKILRNILISVFHAMDPECINTLSLEQIDKFCQKNVPIQNSPTKPMNWFALFNLNLDKVLETKEEERVFIRQLRTARTSGMKLQNS